MSNVAVSAKVGNSLALAAALGGARDSGSSLASFLKFSGKDGRLSYRDGDDDVELPKGTKLALSVVLAQKGYVCWKDGGVIDEYMVPLYETLIPEDELPEHDTSPNPDDNEGWKFQYSVPLKDLATEKEFILKLPSKAGRVEFGKFLKKFGESTGTHDIDNEIPVVTIVSKQFQPKGSRHKPYKPVFEIVEWVDAKTVEFATVEQSMGALEDHSGESESDGEPSQYDDEPMTRKG